MPHLVSISWRISRFVALSSTTRTGRPWTWAGSAGVGRVAGPRARPKRSVKWNVLPRPTSLSSSMVPPIISTNLAEIARPSPVPPYLRVVEVSAWEKARKSFCC